MPITNVLKRSGTISDLIIRRKMLEIGFSSLPMSGRKVPTRIPSTIERRIQWVNVKPPFLAGVASCRCVA